jgi:hypothetical protein
MVSSGGLATGSRLTRSCRRIVLRNRHDRSLADDRLQPLRSAVVAEALPLVPEDDDNPLTSANRARPGVHVAAPVLLPPRSWEALILIADGSSPGASFGTTLAKMVRHPAGTRNPPQGPVSLMQKDGPLNRKVELLRKGQACPPTQTSRSSSWARPVVEAPPPSGSGDQRSSLGPADPRYLMGVGRSPD